MWLVGGTEGGQCGWSGWGKFWQWRLEKEPEVRSFQVFEAVGACYKCEKEQGVEPTSPC